MESGQGDSTKKFKRNGYKNSKTSGIAQSFTVDGSDGRVGSNTAKRGGLVNDSWSKAT